jgi:thiol-disulfide isomerase/thioredoxin
MDRLSAIAKAVGLLSLGLTMACDDGPSKPAAPVEGRVNAVMANGKKKTFADLCDVAPDPSKALSWPELNSVAPAPSNHYRWVNIWATWCKPCVEELPLLSRSFADWKKQGQDVTLTLVSVDADANAANSFIAQRTGLPATLQLKDPAAASSWLSSAGLASGSAIPVHMVLDAQDKLVCARSGGISQTDLERFRAVMFP